MGIQNTFKALNFIDHFLEVLIIKIWNILECII